MKKIPLTQRKTEAAVAEFNKAVAPFRAQYEKAKAPARADYQRAESEAWEQFKMATAPAWEELEKTLNAIEAENEGK